jgi:hypothetical protein
MATTSPDNLWSPDGVDPYALTTDLATMADTVQDALKQPHIPAYTDLAALNAWTPQDGTLAFVQDEAQIYIREGGAWIANSLVVRTFTDVAALTAYTPANGTLAYVTDDKQLYIRTGGAWALNNASAPTYADFATLDAWDAPDGSLGFVTADNRVYVRASGGWQPSSPGAPFSSAAGMVSIPGGSGTTTSATVTFPVGRFTVTPLVTLGVNTTVPERILGPGYSGTSTTGMTIYLRRDNASATNVAWSAIQMTESDASG